MSDVVAVVVKWFLPPQEHDPQALIMYVGRIAAFGFVSFFAVSFIYVGMLFAWGPAVIRPASARDLSTQVSSVKQDVSSSLGTLQTHLDTIERHQHDDRVERLEQQLLWYRQQNCRSKGSARNYTWQKMTELKDHYRTITASEWQMPACADIGE